MPWGAVASVAANYVLSDDSSGTGNASQAANPFGQYNGQFGQQLTNTVNAPGYWDQYLSVDAKKAGGALQDAVYQQPQSLSQYTQDPAFQQILQAGSTNLARQQSAQGYGASGRAMAELQDYGMTQSNGFYQQYLAQKQQQVGNLQSLYQLGQAGANTQYNTLAQLSGLSSASPSAASAAVTKANEAQSSLYNQLGTTVGKGVNQLMASNASQPSYPTAGTGYGDTSAYDNYAPTAVTNGGWGIE